MRYSRDGKCRVEGCDRPIKARLLCEMHYARYRRNGFVEKKSKKYKNHICLAFNCTEKEYLKGLCKYHYMNLKKYNSPFLPITIKLCMVDDCNEKHHAKGLCQYHYNSWKAISERFNIS